ncbi:hypothetical protein MASR2M78_31140 [Treponema sp.]
MKSVRVGIIGTGWVCDHHVQALGKIDEAQIVGIAGRNIPRAKELAAIAEAGIGNAGALTPGVFADYKEMVDTTKPDAVLILLPPHLHGELEFYCAQRVKALLIEKPITNELSQAEEIAASFAKHGTLVSVAYMNRYRTALKRARADFSGATDKPALVNGWWVGDMPGPDWWRNKVQSGGQFVEQCTHLVDASRFIVGEITDVSAFSTRGFVADAENYSVDDAITVNVRFASGAIGNFTTACHLQKGFETRSGIGLNISSRTCEVRFSGWEMTAEFDRGSKGIEKLLAEPGIFEIEDRAFINAILDSKRNGLGHGSMILSSYEDAIKTLKVTLAAEESIQSGKSIRL